MNISRQNIDDLNAVLKIQLTKEDYDTKVQDVLKDYRKRVNIDGFRKGKVPFGLINKMYGKHVLVEEINKMINENLTKYIIENKLNILGEPLPNENEQKSIDWDNDTEFEFSFNLGFMPEIEVNLSKKDKINYYNIKVDEKLTESYVDSYAKRFGSFQTTDKVESEGLLRGKFEELNSEGKVIEEGIITEEAMISVDAIRDEKVRKQFIGASLNDTITFNLKKAFPNNTEIAAMLKIDKEKAGTVENDFQYTITSIQSFAKSEINQDLFDKAFGKDEVKSEEEFKAKINEEIKENLKYESDYKLMIDLKDKATNKIDVPLPVEFLKKWLLAINKDLTADQIDKDFDHFASDFKWQIIKDKIAKENNINITEKEVVDYAKEMTIMQFKQYGLNNIPEEHVENYAKEIVKKDEERRKIYDKKYEDKVIEYLKKTIKIEEKEVSSDEFRDLFN